MSNESLRVEKAIYGGDGLARTEAGEVVFVPFALPGELVERISPDNKLQVLQPSPERVAPPCVHFGVCGGCQYQMATYGEQLRLKQAILRETLERAGVADLPAIRVWGSPEPWGYRNRIRLRVRDVDGAVRLGYSVRGTNDFLPIRMCPIAALPLWTAAAALMRVAEEDRDAAEWLRATTEVEFACNERADKLQVQLLCPGAVPGRKGGFERMAQKLQALGIPLVSMGVSHLHVASGRATEELAAWGTKGLAYGVGEDRFWLGQGSFFQVNRFLVPTMVDLVCPERRGALAWDLYAGVGLFSRRLARQFGAVTAVEANPLAVSELRRGLGRPGDQAVAETTLGFLRGAVLQRERPELAVLDPPRAGAGEAVCELLLRLKPEQIVYVSCDPTTLARDLQILTAGYGVSEVHMIDLFPQTYHLETVMVLKKRTVGG